MIGKVKTATKQLRVPPMTEIWTVKTMLDMVATGVTTEVTVKARSHVKKTLALNVNRARIAAIARTGIASRVMIVTRPTMAAALPRLAPICCHLRSA
jgi:hypothetical protein